jgi:signal peptidase I
LRLIPRPQSQFGAVVELVVIVALAVGLALAIQRWVVKPFQIPSGSMIPTLEIHERVLVNRLTYQFGDDPEIGDIVVFHPPTGASGDRCGAMKTADGATDSDPATYGSGQACPLPTPERKDEYFIKRVVAGPGDTLRIENGHPIVNGEAIPDEAAQPCPGCDFPEEIEIPEDHYFMMGDNRNNSQDSRFWGPVPRDWIIGDAFWTYWPPSRFGPL